MHDNKHACSPVIITTALYGTRMVHILIWVCALIYNSVSPSNLARHLGHQYLPQTAEVILRLLAPPPRCSHHQAEACCTAQTARAAWHATGTSALISANRSSPGVPERACGTDVTLGHSPEHGSGVRCKGIHVTVSGARQFHSSAMVRRMWNETTSGCRSLAARGRDPVGAHYLGDDASLRVVIPPDTATPRGL